MKKRSLLFMILMTFITLGIYQLYWYIKFQMELKAKTKKGFGGLMHFLVTILTLCIYAIVWQYKAGKRLAMQGASDLSVIYLIFVFIGLSWLNPFLMQHQANNLKKMRKIPRFDLGIFSYPKETVFKLNVL